MSGRLEFPAVIMRGGTSRGIFFRGGVLPDEPAVRDRIFLRVLGGGDPHGRQIDGLGGATSSTSKAVVVSRSRRPDADVDYLFAQVGVDTPVVDYRGSCGNLLAAVGPFAMEEGLVAGAQSGETTVRIWQVNTEKHIVAHIPSEGGLPKEEGGYYISGIPNPGAQIRLDLLEPGGASTGLLLPTGSPVDRLALAGAGTIEVTLLDASTPSVFVRACDVGISGSETALELNRDRELAKRLEQIRAAASVAMGLAATLDEATRVRPGTPRLVVIAEPAAYTASDGSALAAGDVDLLARAVSMQTFHHAIQGTSSIATAVAAVVPGTIVQRAASAAATRPVRIGHSSGTIEVGVDLQRRGADWHVERATVSRTARRLMSGSVAVPASVLAAAHI